MLPGMDHASLNRQRCKERGEGKKKKKIGRSFRKVLEKKKKNANEITGDRSYNTFE